MLKNCPKELRRYSSDHVADLTGTTCDTRNQLWAIHDDSAPLITDWNWWSLLNDNAKLNLIEDVIPRIVGHDSAKDKLHGQVVKMYFHIEVEATLELPDTFQEAEKIINHFYDQLPTPEFGSNVETIDMVLEDFDIEDADEH